MKRTLLILPLLTLISIQSFGALNWITRPDLPSLNRDRATGFSIGQNLYVGTGYISMVAQNDFWQFDTQTGVWTQIASLTGIRMGASGFAANGNGYVAWGANNAPYTFYSDLQEYVPSLNTWSTKTPMPATGRYGASCFVLNGKAYLVCGNFQSASGPFTNEVWEYDTSNDFWQLKAPYPNGAMYYTTAFSLGGFGYAGGGGIRDASGNYIFNDEFYRYDQLSDTWIPIAPYPGGEVSGMSTLVINQKAIVGTGNYTNGIAITDFYIYDPSTGAWSNGPSLPMGEERSLSVGLTTSSSGFISTGISAGTGMNDLWELTETVSTIENQTPEISMYYNGANIILENVSTKNNYLGLFNMQGKLIRSFSSIDKTPDLFIADGVYLAIYSEEGIVVKTQKISVY